MSILTLLLLVSLSEIPCGQVVVTNFAIQSIIIVDYFRHYLATTVCTTANNVQVKSETTKRLICMSYTSGLWLAEEFMDQVARMAPSNTEDIISVT